jgi:amino acid transporter
MSNTSKTWIAVIVVVVIIIIGWLWYVSSNNNPNSLGQYNNTVQNQQVNQTSLSTNASSPTDSSDAGLQQDLNAADNQINNINTDTSNATQGLSSSPTPTAQ